jgi:hypothetical protein
MPLGTLLLRFADQSHALLVINGNGLSVGSVGRLPAPGEFLISVFAMITVVASLDPSFDFSLFHTRFLARLVVISTMTSPS